MDWSREIQPLNVQVTLPPSALRSLRLDIWMQNYIRASVIRRDGYSRVSSAAVAEPPLKRGKPSTPVQASAVEIRLDIRIRNQIRARAALRESNIDIALSGEPKLSRLRAKAKSMLRGPADAVRRFFTAPVRVSVDQLHARMEQVNTRVEQLDVLVAQLDMRSAQANAVQKELADRVETLIGMFGARLDEIEVKGRPLVALDDVYAVRLGDGYVLAPKDEPAFLLMLADASTGGLEPGTRRVIKRLLEPGATAIDVGANIGLLTMACARSVGHEGKVYSFEPEKRIADLLARTIAMNGLSQVRLLRQAVGAQPGKQGFNVSKIPGHSSLFALPESEAGHVQEVDIVRLDDVVEAGSRVDLVKIDVEGAELDVIKGMSRILAENPDIAIIAEFGPSHLQRVGISTTEWFAAFEAHGFRALAIEEPTGSCVPANRMELEAAESTNLVFVRPHTATEARLKS